MPKSKLFPVLIILALLTAAETRGQDRGVINVEGATLQSRLDAALGQDRSRSGPARFGVGYSFEIRPGVGIGKSSDADAVVTLEYLYATVTDRELKERIIDAALKNQDRETAIRFLTRIVENERDAQLREHALNRLRKKAGQKIKG